MIERIPPALQANVAELLDLLRVAQINAFGRDVSFLRRERKGRPYWYVRAPQRGGERPERYLGAETPDLLAAIEAAKGAQDAAAARRAIVRGLRAAGLPAPDDRTGRLLQRLADSGAFRLRSVLVGTVAFQTYAALLGVRLPQAAVRTADVDLAQDYGVSVALDDALDTPLLDILRQFDHRFQPIAPPLEADKAVAYQLPDGFRVDVLTTHRGVGKGSTAHLRALGSDATPLPFMDFLLRAPVDALVLHDDGVLVRAPDPARFAVHKLIVARRRGTANPKVGKDLSQAQTLIGVLAETDPFALREAYAEALARGPAWRKALEEAASLLPEAARAALGG